MTLLKVVTGIRAAIKALMLIQEIKNAARFQSGSLLPPKLISVELRAALSSVTGQDAERFAGEVV